MLNKEVVPEQSIRTRPFAGYWVLKVLAFILLVGIVLLPRTLPFPRLFITFDEVISGVWMGQMTRALVKGDWENTTNIYPAVTLMWAEAAQVGIAHLLPDIMPAPAEMLLDTYEASFSALPRRRLALALLNTAAVIAAYWLLRRLYDNFVAAAATILIALDPFLLTQSRVFRTEGLPIGLMLLSTLTTILYVKERRDRWLIISGVLGGLVVLTKVSALYLLPFTGFVLLAWPILVGPRNFRPWLTGIVRGLLVWSLVVGVTCFVLWPALWVAPVRTLSIVRDHTAIIATSLERTWGQGSFFRGELIRGDPGLLFYAWALAFRTTPLVWLGLFLAGGTVFLFLWQQRRNFLAGVSSLNPVVPPSLLLLAYAIFFFIGMSFGKSKVDRYLLPIFPALSILAALGFSMLLNPISRLLERRMGQSRAGATMIVTWSLWGVLLLGGAGLALPHHPYYFTYWNPLLGGGQAAVKMLPAGSGEGIDVLIDSLNRLPNASELKLFKETNIVSPYCEITFEGSCLGRADFLVTDYVLTDIFSRQRQQPLANIEEILPEAELVGSFSKDGVDYVQLYKMPDNLQAVGQWVGEHGRFSGYSLSSSEVGAGDTLEVRIFWLNGDKGWTLKDSEFFVRARDEGDQIYQAAPGVLQNKAKLYEASGQILRFAAALDLPADIGLGEYELEIGLRLKESGEETWQFPLKAPGNRVTVKRGILPGSGEVVAVPYGVEGALDGSGLKLLGYGVEGKGLSLYWQREGAVAEEYRYRLVLKDRQGQVVGWWSDRVGPELHPLAEWQAGEVVKVSVKLETAKGLETGRYLGELEVLGENGAVKKRIELGAIEGGWAGAERVVRVGLEPVRFGEGLELIGYEAEGRGSGTGGELVVRLNWLNRGAEEGEVRVAVLGEKGELLEEAIQELPERRGLWTWQGVSEHRFELGNLPGKLEVQVRPVGREEWLDVAGQPGSDRLVIDDILSKTIMVQP